MIAARAHSPILYIVALASACDGSTADPSAGTGGDRTIAIDGDPNGLHWDSDAGELLIADDNGNRVLAWDGDETRVVAMLPETTADSPGLGQVVRLGDGTIVVSRFGFGSAGDVATIAPDGSTAVVPGLDPERRRIGLTVADDGTIYSGWFVKVGDEQIGAVGTLDLAGTETPIVDGLGKVVGVHARGEALYVAVQNEREVIRVSRADGSVEGFAAELDAPDMLTPGPDGTIFVSSSDGSVSQIEPDGTFTRVVSGLQEVRGVA